MVELEVKNNVVCTIYKCKFVFVIVKRKLLRLNIHFESPPYSKENPPLPPSPNPKIKIKAHFSVLISQTNHPVE